MLIFDIKLPHSFTNESRGCVFSIRHCITATILVAPCRDTVPWVGLFKQQTCFFIVLLSIFYILSYISIDWKLDIRALALSSSCEVSNPGLQTITFSLCAPWHRKEVRVVQTTLWCLYKRVLIPIWRPTFMTSSKPNYFPKNPSTDHHHLGIRASTFKFESGWIIWLLSEISWTQHHLTRLHTSLTDRPSILWQHPRCSVCDCLLVSLVFCGISFAFLGLVLGPTFKRTKDK